MKPNVFRLSAVLRSPNGEESERAKKMITTNFIITFPISESVENCYFVVARYYLFSAICDK